MCALDIYTLEARDCKGYKYCPTGISIYTKEAEYNAAAIYLYHSAVASSSSSWYVPLLIDTMLFTIASKSSCVGHKF